MTDTDPILREEVQAVMLRVVLGEEGIRRITAKTWQDVYAGNVEYETSDGWRLVFFNDCNDLDYLDSCTAPDGRTADFDDWVPGEGDYPRTSMNPIDRQDLWPLAEILEVT